MLSHTAAMPRLRLLAAAFALVLLSACQAGNVPRFDRHVLDESFAGGYGVEIADANVLGCVQRGVNVIQLNLEDGLALFEDASFDVVLADIDGAPMADVEGAEVIGQDHVTEPLRAALGPAASFHEVYAAAETGFYCHHRKRW